MEWEIETDLAAFREMAEIDSNVKWPSVEVKQICSPPKGRARKNIHNISNSSTDDSQVKKKNRLEDEITFGLYFVLFFYPIRTNTLTPN